MGSRSRLFDGAWSRFVSSSAMHPPQWMHQDFCRSSPKLFNMIHVDLIPEILDTKIPLGTARRLRSGCQRFDTRGQPIQRHHSERLNDGRITAAYFGGVSVKNQNTLRFPAFAALLASRRWRCRMPAKNTHRLSDGGTTKLLFGGIPNRS